MFSKKTSYGIRYGFNNLINYKDFSESVPIVNYEEFYPEIKKVLFGEENVLWPEKIKWFAKSSGTTNDKSKFIPVSQTALNQGHYKAGIDMLSIYLSNYNSSNLFDGKSLALGGSKQINPIGNAERLFTSAYYRWQAEMGWGWQIKNIMTMDGLTFKLVAQSKSRIIF